MNSKNLLVIGGGPGGYTAAFLAADLGMRVTLVDTHDKPGGVCLHRGCIPSKALLHIARLISETRQSARWGVTFSAPVIDFDVMRRWKSEIVDKMSGGLVNLCKRRGVTLVHGRAVFKNSNTVVVDGKDSLGFDHAILATGSHPVVPEEFASGGPAVMDSTAALELRDTPKCLLIVGGGYIGLEMGTFYAALGSRVTVVEMTDGLLPGVDRDLTRTLQARLKKDFENIYLNTKVTSLVISGDGARVGFQGEAEPKDQNFDRILVCVGRKPNSAGIGLENTKVQIDARGFVQVDDRQRTADPAIHAIGDVIGGAMLAHKASREAKTAVETIAGHKAEPGKIMPAVVFTDPEIAWCGLTETEARVAGREVRIAAFPWGASGRAMTLDRGDGLTKLILEPGSDRILGVGIVGAGAGELIAEGALAIEMGATAKTLTNLAHPHPTLSETLMEAAEAHYGLATHIYKPLRK